MEPETPMGFKTGASQAEPSTRDLRYLTSRDSAAAPLSAPASDERAALKAYADSGNSLLDVPPISLRSNGQPGMSLHGELLRADSPPPLLVPELESGRSPLAPAATVDDDGAVL